MSKTKKPKIRAVYDHAELLELITQNLDQCDDPEWIADKATQICGPLILWNEKKKKKCYEEYEP